jgi:hypothetical protein
MLLAQATKLLTLIPPYENSPIMQFGETDGCIFLRTYCLLGNMITAMVYQNPQHN